MPLKNDAQAGGKIAGDARKALELETEKKISRKENFLVEPESKKRIKTDEKTNL